MRVYRGNNVLAAPRWALDFGGREHIVPFPAIADPSKFIDGAGANVVLTSQGSAGTNEIQTLTIDATGGTFTLSFLAQVTGAIAYNANADAIRDALEALSTVGVGNVSVTGAGPFSITFINALGHQNVAALVPASGSLTGNTHTAAIVTATPGASGDVTLAVTALNQSIPGGSVLQFGTGLYATTTADAAVGDVSIPVTALTVTIPNGSTAVFSRYGTETILSGTVVGRTTAERLANTAWRPAAADGSDDEVYLVVFEVFNAHLKADIELYRHNSLVAENYLPQWTLLQTGGYTGLLAKLRAVYTCVTGQD